ncbi:glutamine amidotransferase-related protein [Marinomonas profundimaris]|uniref:Glutamine amidotransferase n=1 Tax=Marinomonas profundimaris TaxID=1208321 RepID=W1RXP9_9GAMM|nr:glutamine amidotransferase [Marinomonas profundimaris]ETI61732.1 glutamine amidotransferase [Marinomonas profundimaris]
MRIGILAAGITRPTLLPSFGSYADMFVTQFAEQDSTFEFDVFDVRDGVFPSHADVCDAWLITGSRSNVYEDLSWMQQLKVLIQEIDAKKQPLVGICFGHQIIAEALGGGVVKFAGGWGVGIHDYEVVPNVKDIVLPEPPSHISICAMHQDQVVLKPTRAKVFARSAFCENAGLVYDKHIVTLQGHPEFSAAYEAALIDNIKGDSFSLEVAEQGLSSVRKDALNSPEVIAWLVEFIKSGDENRLSQG